MNYDDVEDDVAAEYQDRQRQAADLDYIRRYYALEQRHGIRVAIGGRVRNHGQEGTIVDTSGQYLMVQFDGEDLPARRHATSNMEYATAAGWVAATPAPDLYDRVQPVAWATEGSARNQAARWKAHAEYPEPISDGTMPCPVRAPVTGHPCVKRIPNGWAAAEGHGGGHFWQAPEVAELEARGAHYDPSTLLSGKPTPWHLPEDCSPDCWKWRG